MISVKSRKSKSINAAFLICLIVCLLAPLANANFPVWKMSGDLYEPELSNNRVVTQDTYDGTLNGFLSVLTTLDDLEVILSEDFETGLGDFTIGKPNGLWHPTEVCNAIDPNHSLATALYFGLDSTCTYDDPNTASEGAVYSPVINLMGYESPILLEFNYFLETENAPGVDLASVEVSQNGGLFYDYLRNDVGSLEDPSSGWTRVGLDLSPMAGMEIQIRFRFRTIDGQFNDFPGFYVDDVLIRGTPAEPPLITSTPVTEAIVGQLYTYEVDATGKPAPTYSLDGTEPNGMVIDPNSGLITWTPTALELGPNAVTVTAGNGKLPDDSQSFVIDVNEIPVYFADPNFQFAVEQELGVIDPLPSDMLNLIDPNMANKSITDLTGIEYALNLTALNLAQNQIIELFPLSELGYLIFMDLSDNQISNIKPISHFSSLLYLDLVMNPLGRSAYCAHLPAIKNANPGIDLRYDPSPYTARLGDCDGDCDVDFVDFSILSHYWLEVDCGLCGGADFTGEGNVDGADLEVLAYNWLQADVCDGDCDGDCDVDLVDFSILSSHWLEIGCGDCGGADLTGDNNVDLKDFQLLGLNWLANL